ncbi:unnamed protein product [Cylindrotheca closterium]|uniref:TauD/TfdA-like domain-containing protein n=1 Tax=Cylindrotheca closterium TaxID=2856 RepID=A0AAD2G8U2_9STRA|nr:unnamed protein product [Cylindrotheca closterium]
MIQILLHILLLFRLPLLGSSFSAVVSSAGRRTEPSSSYIKSSAGIDRRSPIRLNYQVGEGRNLLVEDAPSFCNEFTSPLDCGLQHIETSLLPSSATSDNSVYVMPLVISPKNYTKNFCLRGFIKNNRDWIDQQVSEYGAVLFRGFDINSAAEVEQEVKALEPDLSNDYRGTSPRNAVDGSTYVFSAAEVPSHYPIAQHLEMSFLPAPPRRLFFSALQAPKTKGGETALSDFRKVYRDIPEDLREKLARKKLRYTRTHYRKGANPLFTNDISSLESWQDVFRTSDKSKVEEIAAKENFPVRWEGRKKDVFVSEYQSEPFQLHPVTKEPVWFNHAQVFHWTTYPAELWNSYKRIRDIRLLLQSARAWVMAFATYVISRRKMALTVTFGDGEPFSMKEMGSIRKTIHRHMTFNRWQKGDLLEIDNFAISHGREPTYDKGRKIVVAWSSALNKSNDPVYGLSP